MKISGVYKIVNITTGDCYIGSTVDLKKRKIQHFCESVWKQEPNKQLYKDMKQYGKDSFLFQPIWFCKPEELKKYEQIAIDKYKPTYNVRASFTGLTKQQYKQQYQPQYRKENADAIKQYQQQYQQQYRKENADAIKQYNKQYYKENADAIKQYKQQYYKENADAIKQHQQQYYKRQCLYKGEILSLCALRNRFIKKGIQHPTQEAKKYLM